MRGAILKEGEVSINGEHLQDRGVDVENHVLVRFDNDGLVFNWTLAGRPALRITPVDHCLIDRFDNNRSEALTRPATDPLQRKLVSVDHVLAVDNHFELSNISLVENYVISCEKLIFSFVQIGGVCDQSFFVVSDVDCDSDVGEVRHDVDVFVTGRPSV